jgi:hypothetical protein
MILSKIFCAVPGIIIANGNGATKAAVKKIVIMAITIRGSGENRIV